MKWKWVPIRFVEDGEGCLREEAELMVLGTGHLGNMGY